MAGLSLRHINKVYPGGNQAVFDFCLDIHDKEFIVFVGPSGCGKSTTLRMVAGLEDISSGELYIGERFVNDVVPKDRDIAMVFQNYALYPHMSVYDNMAFGLKLRKVPKEEIDEKVQNAAEILGIKDYLSRKPKALSGGQRQRVALGRTIVREPQVFLLDEPLSNLDAKLRAQMRTEISKLHARLATTFIYVTHDQIEAMTMGTRIVVMKDGFMQQVDTPQNLYDYPINLFVAGFIGTPQMNFFHDSTLTGTKEKVYVNFLGGNKILLPKAVIAKIKNLDDYLNTGRTLTLGVRPEDIHEDTNFLAASPETVIKAKIDVIEKLGAETQIYCDLDYESEKNSLIDNSTQMIAKISSRAVIKLGDIVELAFDAMHVHMFDGETQATMLERDEGYEVIPENAEGSAFVPPTPQEMQERIAAAKVVTKEEKKRLRKQEKMAAKKAQSEENAQAEDAFAAYALPVEEKKEEPAPAPVEEKKEEPAPAPVEEKKEEPAPAPVEEKKEEPAPTVVTVTSTTVVEEKTVEEAPAKKPVQKKPAQKKTAQKKPAQKKATKPAAAATKKTVTTTTTTTTTETTKPAQKKPAQKKPAAKPAVKDPAKKPAAKKPAQKKPVEKAPVNDPNRAEDLTSYLSKILKDAHLGADDTVEIEIKTKSKGGKEVQTTSITDTADQTKSQKTTESVNTIKKK